MDPRNRPAPRRRRIAYRIVAITVGVCALAAPPRLAPWGEFLSPIGAAYAVDPPQQKDAADSATKGVPSASRSAQDMQAIRELLERQPAGYEYRRMLLDRERKAEALERALERKERELLTLQRDIEEKLRRLEGVRQELETRYGSGGLTAVAKKAEAARQAEIDEAAKRFRAIGPDAAAQLMLEMDMESATVLLRNLRAENVGQIFDAMAGLIETGTDADREKMEKMGKIWERLLTPGRPVETAAVAQQDSALPAAR